MLMLKHQQVLSLMTLEQKLRIFVSGNDLESGECEGFSMPKIHLLKDINGLVTDEDLKLTAFPLDKMLMNSFDLELNREIQSVYAEEVYRANPLCLLKSSASLKNSGLTTDSFYLSKYLEVKMDGIASYQNQACYDSYVDEYTDEFSEQYVKLPKVMVENYKNFKYIVVHSPEDLLNYKRVSIKSYFIGCTKKKEDLVTYIKEGVSFICYLGQDYDKAIAYLLQAIKEYKNFYGKYANDLISAKEFGEKFDSGKILDEELFNQRLDDFLELINQIKKEQQAFLANHQIENSALAEENIYRNELSYEAALQSIVLLKNEDNILPLTVHKKVAIIGDWFENDAYLQSRYKNTFTKTDVPLEHLSSCPEINTVGYAHGYMKDREDVSLNAIALDLCNKADVALVFLWNKDDSKTLNKIQLSLIKNIHDKGLKVIAVVNSKYYLDLNFEEYCSAILYLNDGGQNARNAILDIINGDKAPAGYLASEWAFDLYGKNVNNANFDEDESKNPIRYPFGFGLSYGDIRFENLRVNESRALVNVINTGTKASYGLCLLYVKSDKQDNLFFNKQLRGFKKVYLEPGESKVVEFPFDGYTFRQLISTKKGYGNKSGEYQIIVGANAFNEELTTTIELKERTESYFEFYNELDPNHLEKDINEFLAYVPTPSKMSYGRKMTLIIFLLVYFDLIFVGIFSMLVMNMKSLNKNESIYAWYITLIAAIIYNIVMGIIIFRTVRLHHKEVNNSKTLPNRLASLKTFGETNVVTVEKPKEVVKKDTPIDEVVEVLDKTLFVVEEEQKEEIQEENLDALVEESTVSAEDLAEYEEQMRIIEEMNMAALFANSDDEIKIVYDNESSISQLMDKFYDFALKKGLKIDLKSIRSVFGVLASSKLVVLGSKALELMPKFLTILAEFLGSVIHPLHAADSWVSAFNLSWCKDDNGNYVKTEFITDVYNANKQKESLNLAVIDNVDMKNVKHYLKDIIDFAYTPTGKHAIKLNQKLSVPIPENIIFILVPKEGNYFQEMPLSLANCVSTIEINMFVEGTEAKVENLNCLSSKYLDELIYEAKKKSYLSEEAWKKLDGIYYELSKLFPIKMSSKFPAIIERYSALLLDCGEFEVDVLDYIVSEKIIPVILCSDYAKKQENHKQIIEIIEKVLGEGNANRSIRVFNNYQTMSAKTEEPTNKETIEESLEEEKVSTETNLESENTETTE